jgi:hypothetical protein
MQDMCNFADCVPMSAFTRKMTISRRTGIKKSHPKVAEKDDGTS